VRRGTKRVFVGKLQRKRPLGRLGVDGIIILKWTFKRWDGIMQRSELTENMDWLWAVVYAIMNIRIPYNAGNS